MTRPPSFTLPPPPRTLLPRLRLASPPPANTFRWLDLPTELQLTIVDAVDDRDRDDALDGARGPPEALLRLSATARWFNSACRPLVWRVVKYKPDLAGRRDRNLRSLVDNLPGNSALPVRVFSVDALSAPDVDLDEDVAAFAEHRDECDALLTILNRIRAATSLKILSVDLVRFNFSQAVWVREFILRSHSLLSVRLRRLSSTADCALVSPSREQQRWTPQVAQPPRVKALQVMESDSVFSTLIAVCSSVHSLVYRPPSAYEYPYPAPIKRALPHLRSLSLGTKLGKKGRGNAARKIRSLSIEGTVFKLRELVLAGPFSAGDLVRLVDALGRLPTLYRLVLEGLEVSSATAELVDKIVEAAPQLQGLTLIVGDGSEFVAWPSSLNSYIDVLSKLRHLMQLVWNLAPLEPPLSIDLFPFYTTSYKLGTACTALRAVLFVDDMQDERMHGELVTYEREGDGFDMAHETQTVCNMDLIYDDWLTVH